MMKVFEADQKRLKSILQTYEEKKADLPEKEKKQREEVIQMLKDAFNLFKQSYNEQTMILEKGKMKQDLSARGENMEMPSRIETQSNVSRMYIGDNETINAFVDDPRDLRKIEHQSQDFDTLINTIVSPLFDSRQTVKKDGQDREGMGIRRL